MFCKPTRVKYTFTESTVVNTKVKQLCKTSSSAKKLDTVKLRRENSNTQICKLSKGQTRRLQAHVVLEAFHHKLAGLMKKVGI